MGGGGIKPLPQFENSIQGLIKKQKEFIDYGLFSHPNLPLYDNSYTENFTPNFQTIPVTSFTPVILQPLTIIYFGDW